MDKQSDEDINCTSDETIGYQSSESVLKHFSHKTTQRI